MRKFSKKNNKKIGGDCSLIKSQFSKVTSLLGPDGAESKVINELTKTLEGANNYIENFLLVKIQKLREIFNSNTNRKTQIKEMITQLEDKLKEVEQQNTNCYDKLKVDPKGEEFGIKTSDEKMKELYGENIDEYNNAQIDYLYNLLNDNPVVGIQKESDPADLSPTTADDEEIQVEDETDQLSQSAPEWKKRNSETKLKSYDKSFEMNYFDLIADVRNFVRRRDPSLKSRIQLIKGTVLPALQNAESIEEVQQIINDNQLTLMKANMGGRKSKRINRLRKYRSKKL